MYPEITLAVQTLLQAYDSGGMDEAYREFNYRRQAARRTLRLARRPAYTAAARSFHAQRLKVWRRAWDIFISKL